jgi:quercetin dioxygenase-like cupin family protein
VVTKVRRVVTGHDLNGEGAVLMDGDAPPQGRGVLVWSTSNLPPDNREAYDGTVGSIIANQPEGTNLNMWTFPPGFMSGMHRTDTLDYIYVISGSVELVLDNDLRVELSAGDVLVQRGTVHAWVNKGAEPCTMIGTVIKAQKLDLPNSKWPTSGDSKHGWKG